MAENLGKWPSKRGPISKIRPSDGCGGGAVLLALGLWYDFHEVGCHLGNVGLIKMTWGQYDGDWINHRQSKGKKKVAVPVHRDLKKVLDRVPRRSTMILTTPTGLPWKSDWFRNRWREASVAAGIKDLHFHDLRGTAVTRLAEAGCSNAEIAAITGHTMNSVETILVKYLSLTRDLARSAMTKLENAGRNDYSGLV